MSLHLCMLFILNKHLYTFYIYMQYLSRGMLVVTLAAAPVVTPFTSFRASVWITHIVTWSGPVHRSQASLRGAATRGRKTALGGLRCADPPGATMWVIHTLALNEVNGVTSPPI